MKRTVQSENEWNNMTGAGYYVTQPFTEYVFIGSNFSDYDNCLNAANGDPNQMQICESTYFQWVTHDVTFFVRDPSDGVVPFRSQVAQNTSWTANAEVYELPNNNHNEVVRSTGSRNELNRAFDGVTGGFNFFIPTR